MFVGSSYNETMGDSLSDVSDRSSNYFTMDMEHRNTHIQVQFSYPGGEFSYPGGEFSYPGGEFSYPGERDCLDSFLPEKVVDPGSLKYVCIK